MSRISEQIRRDQERRRDEQRRQEEECRRRDQEENRRRVEENNRRQEAKRREDEARRAREEQERRRQSEAYQAKLNSDRVANNLASLQRSQPDNWMAITSAETSIQLEKSRAMYAQTTIAAEDGRLRMKSISQPKPLLFPVNLDGPRRVSKPPGLYWQPDKLSTDTNTPNPSLQQVKAENKTTNIPIDGKSSSIPTNFTTDCGLRDEINVDPNYDSNILKYGVKAAMTIPGGGPLVTLTKVVIKTTELIREAEKEP